MTARIFKLTATVCATGLLAGFGTVAATSASAAAAPATTTVATHAAPASTPAAPTGILPPWGCDGVDLLGLICLDVDLDVDL